MINKEQAAFLLDILKHPQLTFGIDIAKTALAARDELQKIVDAPDAPHIDLPLQP